MTFEKLKVRTRKELAAMAKRHHVTGWHGMKKDELIEALLAMHSGRKKSRGDKAQSTSPRAKASQNSRSRARTVARRTASQSGNPRKILNGSTNGQRDKLTAQACDPCGSSLAGKSLPE